MKLVKTCHNEYGVIVPDGTAGELKLKVRMLNIDSTFKKDENGEYIHQYLYADSLNFINQKWQKKEF